MTILKLNSTPSRRGKKLVKFSRDQNAFQGKIRSGEGVEKSLACFVTPDLRSDCCREERKEGRR